MIQKENMRSFYKNVEIDFPWMMFEESAFAWFWVNLGQKDTFI
jgi:hypothetical protein